MVNSQQSGVGRTDLVEGTLAGIPRPRTHTSQPDSSASPAPAPAPRPPTEPKLVPVEDLDRVMAELVKVVVRTSADGSCQENGLFLLGMQGDRWAVVPFTDPGANDLVPLLRALPEFNADLLMEIIGARREGLVVLWERAEP